jgi:hypothetical protein
MACNNKFAGRHNAAVPSTPKLISLPSGGLHSRPGFQQNVSKNVRNAEMTKLPKREGLLSKISEQNKEPFFTM